MNLISDPYHDASKEVEQMFKQADALLIRLNELEQLKQPNPTSTTSTTTTTLAQGSSKDKQVAQVEDEITWDLKELASCLGDLQESLHVLNVSVVVAEKKSSTFKIDHVELTRRKDNIQV